jgi:hypothetical protein
VHAVSEASRTDTGWRWFKTPDRRILLASLVLQLALGLAFGHSTDTRIFMATGYLAGTGQDPYVASDLTGVFHNDLFESTSSIGYPPPWPLLLGLLYRASYAVVHELLVYNLALKLPVIAATIALAYLTGVILQHLGASPAASRRAWAFVLLNPFLLFTGAAWGQIDVIVALCALAALVLLANRRWDGSAGLLALAFTFKPIALPILPVALLYLAAGSMRRALRYAAVFLGGVLALYVLPFFAFGWSRDPFFQHLNAHFTMLGTMSYMTLVRVVRGLDLFHGSWWLLGILWLPALAIGVVLVKRGDGGLEDLIRKSTALILIVFLTRTWLAEANIVLVLPLVLILASTGALDRRALTAVWVIPLLFTVLNASPLHVLWVAFPGELRPSIVFVNRYSDIALLLRAGLVVAWQLAGWWIVVACLRRRPVGAAAQAQRAAAAGRLVPWS